MNVAPFATSSARDRPVGQNRLSRHHELVSGESWEIAEARTVRARSGVAFDGNSSGKTQGFA
jgi:hypothetical protein